MSEKEFGQQNKDIKVMDEHIFWDRAHGYFVAWGCP